MKRFLSSPVLLFVGLSVETAEARIPCKYQIRDVEFAIRRTNIFLQQTDAQIATIQKALENPLLPDPVRFTLSVVLFGAQQSRQTLVIALDNFNRQLVRLRKNCRDLIRSAFSHLRGRYT